MVKGNPKISKEQEEVLRLLTDEFLTPKKIAIIRKTSIRAVYKTINKLKSKGFLRGFNKGFKGFTKSISSTSREPLKSNHYIRLHGQEFHIEILYKSDFYEKQRGKGNIITLENNTIKLNKNTIEVYSHKDFNAEDTQRATALSFNYWNRIITILENQLKIILVKDRKHNIRLVNAHYSEVHNEIATELNNYKEKLRIYTTEEGKLWFLIDNSFNLNEAETLHSETSKQDMDKVKAVFNDIRDKPIYLPSETKTFLDRTNDTLNKLTEVTILEIKNKKLHQKVLESMDRTLKQIRGEYSRQRKLKDNHQTSLGVWI